MKKRLKCITKWKIRCNNLCAPVRALAAGSTTSLSSCPEIPTSFSSYLLPALLSNFISFALSYYFGSPTSSLSYLVPAFWSCPLPTRRLLSAPLLPDCLFLLLLLILKPSLHRRLVLYLVQLQLILYLQLSEHSNKPCQICFYAADQPALRSFFVCSWLLAYCAGKVNASSSLTQRS